MAIITNGKGVIPNGYKNSRAHSQAEVGQRKSHRSRHYFHWPPGTGVLLRRPWRSVTVRVDAARGAPTCNRQIACAARPDTGHSDQH